MKQAPIELIVGKVQGFDPNLRTYKVTTSDGREIIGCRKVGDAIDNFGGRSIGEILPETEVMLALLFKDSGFDLAEGFILGGFETRSSNGMGTAAAKDVLPEGTQGFTARDGRRILLYSDGRIELRAAPWCQMQFDPKDKSITQFFQKLNSQKDPNNFVRWFFHPESKDLKDALMHIAITGDNSITGAWPDIELFAGALWGLQDQDYMDAMKEYGFEIDKGAILAMRATKQNVENETGKPDTHMFFQLGDLSTGEILDLLIERRDKMKARIKIGEFGEESQLASIEIGDGENDVAIQIYKDGRFKISNANSHIEATGDGSIDAVAAGGAASLHLDKEGEAVVTSTGLKIGSDGATEPQVLGNTLEGILNQIIGLIKDHDHNTGMGPSTAASLGPVSISTVFSVPVDVASIKSENHTVE